MAQDRPLYRQVSSEEVAGPSTNGKSEAYGEGHFISPSRDTQGLGPQEHRNRRSEDSRSSAGFGFGTDNPMEGKSVYQMTQTPTDISGYLFGHPGKVESISQLILQLPGCICLRTRPQWTLCMLLKVPMHLLFSCPRKVRCCGRGTMILPILDQIFPCRSEVSWDGVRKLLA